MRTGQQAIRFIGQHVLRSACGLTRHAGMRAGLHDYGKIAEHADVADMPFRMLLLRIIDVQ